MDAERKWVKERWEQMMTGKREGREGRRRKTKELTSTKRVVLSNVSAMVASVSTAIIQLNWGQPFICPFNLTYYSGPAHRL